MIDRIILESLLLGGDHTSWQDFAGSGTQVRLPKTTYIAIGGIWDVDDLVGSYRFVSRHFKSRKETYS